MATQKYTLIPIVALFGMLWLPLGQYDFLLENWMKIGTYAAPFLCIGALARRDQQVALPMLADFTLLSAGLLVAYIMHQYEEHWIDLFGKHYAFLGYINNIFANFGGCERGTPCPLTPAGIFVINTSLVWLVGVVALWRAPTHMFPALAMAAIAFVNAVSHIGAAVLKWEYNPGLLTAIVLFIPLSLFFYLRVLQVSARYKKQMAYSVIWSIVAHGLMVGGMLLANMVKLIPETVYFIALVAWSCVPLLMFRTAAYEPNQTLHMP